MGIVLKDILAVIPAGDKDEVRETTIYIEGNRIVVNRTFQCQQPMDTGGFILFLDFQPCLLRTGCF